MACSPEQIAAKRQQAMDRLKQNKEKNSPGTPGAVASSAGPSVTPVKFYGQSEQAAQVPKEHPLKMHNKQEHRQQNRIYSQPYNREQPKTVREEKKAPFPLVRTQCKCSMVSEDRFAVSMAQYSQKVADSFKALATRKFERETKLWKFHVKEYTKFLDLMKQMDAVNVDELPKFITKVFMGTKEPPLDMSFLASIEPRLGESLLDFQKEGVRFALEKEGRCIIADEMGLGKTYQAIAIADFYRDDWPLLVCTTASTKDAWSAKLRELLPRLSVQDVHMMDSTQTYLPSALVFISTYTMMEKTVDQILAKNCGILIFDESHYLKNGKTKCTKAAQDLAKKARRVIMLTGTPALSRPVELYSQVSMCTTKPMFSFKEYSRRYCDGKEGRFGWDSTGTSNLPELNVLLTKCFMIRRTKDNVTMELKDKSREIVILDKDLIDWSESLDKLSAEFSQSQGGKREEILINFYRSTADAKKKAVCAYVKNLLKEKQKFIVFCHHRVMMDAISKCLDEQQINYIRIDGSTKCDVRTAMVKMFQTKDNYRVAVLSLKACNEGITLTAAQLVIFAELYWNPSTLAQGEGRSHRIGQEGNVVVRYLMAKGTADDVIWQMINKKQNVLNDAGIGNEDFGKVTSCTEITSTRKISDFFPKEPTAGPSTDDIKKLLDEDDDIFADIDC